MADIAHVRDGFIGFANERVLPHLPQTQQFMAGMLIGLAGSRADVLLNELSGNGTVRALGIIQENGEVDVERLYATAKDQIHRTGYVELTIPMIGALRFNEADLDALYQHINQGG